MVCGERANQITAIWKEPKKEIKEEQYNEFYKFIKLIVLLLFDFLFGFFPDSGDLVGPFTADHNGKAYKIRIFLDDGLDSGLFGVFLLLIFQVNDDFRSPLFFIYRI